MRAALLFACVMLAGCTIPSPAPPGPEPAPTWGGDAQHYDAVVLTADFNDPQVDVRGPLAESSWPDADFELDEAHQGATVNGSLAEPFHAVVFLRGAWVNVSYAESFSRVGAADTTFRFSVGGRIIALNFAPGQVQWSTPAGSSEMRVSRGNGTEALASSGSAGLGESLTLRWEPPNSVRTAELRLQFLGLWPKDQLRFE